MLWTKRHYPGQQETQTMPETDPKATRERLSGDVERYLANGGKIKLVPISQRHKNVLTVSYRLAYSDHGLVKLANSSE